MGKTQDDAAIINLAVNDAYELIQRFDNFCQPMPPVESEPCKTP